MRIIAGVITLAIILLALAFAKDLTIMGAATFEDGSYAFRVNGTWPITMAWRD